MARYDPPSSPIALENLALRQLLANPRCTSGRPRLRKSDRTFWLVLSRFWSRWAEVLVVVKPYTVVCWHRAGFRLFWRWKSRSRSPAESDVSAEVKALIRQMAEANVGWGAPRIRDRSMGFISRYHFPSSRPASSSIACANVTSSAVIPPASWVARSMRTVFQTLNHSG